MMQSIIIFILVFCGMIGMYHLTTYDWQTQIIERGYGEFCPDTGKFAFKGECDKQ